MKQLTIKRWSGEGKIDIDDWKALISALVMAGYEVYGDKERIVFTLGSDDEIKEQK